MRGLKENVIIGKLIPAGTGFDRYKDIVLTDDMKLLEEQKIRDANRELNPVIEDDTDFEDLAEMKTVGDEREIGSAMIDEEE